VTEYEYDEAGRLLRSVTTREPEWSEEDAAWMLALAAYRRGLCPLCGRPLEECTAQDADGAYTVPPPTRCHATTALMVAQERYRDTPQAGALLWVAERR